MRRGIVFTCVMLGAASAAAITLATQPADDAPQHPAALAAGAAPADQQAPADAAAQQIPKWSEASLARPLFAPDRRPFAQAQPTSAPTTALPRLSGIMTTPTGSRAIFAAAGVGKPEVVVEGGSVGGYLVQSIANGEVVLIGPDGRHTLHPSFDAAASPPAPPVAKQATP